MAEGPAAPQIPTSQSPGAAAQALQSLQDRPAEPPVPEVARPNSKTLVDVEGVTYKRCTHCKELKIRDQNFNKDKSRGDGFACTCKSCANRHTRAWHERHKQQNAINLAQGGGALPPQAQCSHCKEFRPRSAFYGDTSQANGLRPHCRDCERDVKRDRRKRKAAAEALTFASHGMNGSEGEAAGLLPAQQKPKRVRRRKSRDQVIQPIAVDLQQVAPDQAAGGIPFEMPHLHNTAAAVQLATTAEDQLAQLQAAQLHAQQLGLALGVALNPANAQQLLALLPQDGSAPAPAAPEANGAAAQAAGAVAGAGGAAPAGGLLVAGGAGMPAPVWIQQPIQPAETEYETASDATLDAVETEPGEVVSSVRRG